MTMAEAAADFGSIAETTVFLGYFSNYNYGDTLLNPNLIHSDSNSLM